MSQVGLNQGAGQNLDQILPELGRDVGVLIVWLRRVVVHTLYI